MGAADHSQAGEGRADALTLAPDERGVDRAHNRDTLSSEAMSQMLRELQDAMLALDERLGALESSHTGVSEDTRRLARGVADMGDALARRVRAIEGARRDPPTIVVRREPPPPVSPPRPRPRPWGAWAAALVFALIAALAAFWLLTARSPDRTPLEAASPPPPAPVTPVPAATPPPRPGAADVTPVVPSPAARIASHTAWPHRATSWRRQAGGAVSTQNATSPPTGFGRYGPSPSPPAPASAPASSSPPT